MLAAVAGAPSRAMQRPPWCARDHSLAESGERRRSLTTQAGGGDPSGRMCGAAKTPRARQNPTQSSYCRLACQPKLTIFLGEVRRITTAARALRLMFRARCAESAGDQNLASRTQDEARGNLYCMASGGKATRTAYNE